MLLNFPSPKFDIQLGFHKMELQKGMIELGRKPGFRKNEFCESDDASLCKMMVNQGPFLHRDFDCETGSLDESMENIERGSLASFGR